MTSNQRLQYCLNKANAYLLEVEEILKRQAFKTALMEARKAKILYMVEANKKRPKKATLEELAKEFGVTKQRIAQLIKEYKNEG